jgi:hypothetical protein
MSDISAKHLLHAGLDIGSLANSHQVCATSGSSLAYSGLVYVFVHEGDFSDEITLGKLCVFVYNKKTDEKLNR